MKFRIPEINEFAEGFEFYVYSDGLCEEDTEDVCGWYKYTYGLGNWRDLEEIKDLIEKELIRVAI